jgi:hypothetical protein
MHAAQLLIKTGKSDKDVIKKNHIKICEGTRYQEKIT